MTLTELRKLAELAECNSDPFHRFVHMNPKEIMALLDVIEAADAVRHCPSGSAYDDARHAYDAARKRLEEL